MKKINLCLFVFLLVFLFTSAVAAAANTHEITALIKSVSINKENTNCTADAIFFQDRIYIPLRSAAEILNVSVEWDDGANAVYLKQQNEFKDFPETDPWIGERFVYGEITGIDKFNYIITIEEHIDDNSIHTEPDISVSKDVIIILQRNKKKMNLDFEDLCVGEYIGLVLDSAGTVRGIISNS